MNVGIQSQRVWRHKRGYQNLQIEDGQTTQWLCEKGQKDKQWSTKLHIEKQRSSNTNPIKKTGDALMCSGRVSSFCSTCGTRRVTLVTNQWCHEWGKYREMLTTRGTYSWSFV